MVPVPLIAVLIGLVAVLTMGTAVFEGQLPGPKIVHTDESEAAALAAISAVADYSAVSPDATLEDQSAYDCGDRGVLLDQRWQAPDGSYWRTFKKPNGSALLVIYWKPGNDERADAYYLAGKEVTIEALSSIGHPCNLIGSGA